MSATPSALSDYDDVPMGPSAKFEVVVLPSGLIWSRFAPARLVETRLHVAGPIVLRTQFLGSAGEIPGWGVGSGLLFGDSQKPFEGHRFGFRYDFFHVEDVGFQHEFFIDWIRSWEFARDWTWHVGGSLGLGATEVKEYSEEYSRDQYVDTEMGLTFRFELGLGYIVF